MSKHKALVDPKKPLLATAVCVVAWALGFAHWIIIFIPVVFTIVMAFASVALMNKWKP